MEVKICHLTNLINVLFKRHILIENNSEVSYICTVGQPKISPSSGVWDQIQQPLFYPYLKAKS